ncbi:lipoprotein insertase outer membrane protein LolB [Noviherbaspirillum aerium]|uniref:lipoprotein insertase outer membrane protein LolB n=1 Tax=Noviherbaspirillum aerium TaxID=2588497 RepID=UPI00124E2941|nr:lipoprotein insertase outer membrane protein LolB [Noviherbaspirillum aerium]
MTLLPHWQRTLTVALLPLLAACSSLAPLPSAAPVASQAAERRLAENIELGGRLSVRYQGPQKEEAVHGSFTWTQAPSQTRITLLSPLGQTIAIIDVSPQGASLSQAGQPVRRAADVDALTAQTLGWPLPVAGLREWLQGIAHSASGQRFVATPEASEVTTRDGWRIRYANWQPDTSSPQARPKRIDLVRNTQQAGEVSIRIAIDSWQEH